MSNSIPEYTGNIPVGKYYTYDNAACTSNLRTYCLQYCNKKKKSMYLFFLLLLLLSEAKKKHYNSCLGIVIGQRTTNIYRLHLYVIHNENKKQETRQKLPGILINFHVFQKLNMYVSSFTERKKCKRRLKYLVN